MVKRITVIILFTALVLCLCFAETPSQEEVNRAFTVIADCLNATLGAQYSTSGVKLPGVNMSVNVETGLPARVAFFLADPYDFRRAIEASVTTRSDGLITTIISSVNRTVKDPYMASIASSLAERGYQMSDYLLAGSITFSYAEGLEIDQVQTILLRRQATDRFMKLNFDLGLYGLKVDTPYYMTGDVLLSVDTNGRLRFESGDLYLINGYPLEGWWYNEE